MCDIMPNGQVKNFNHKKVKEVLAEFFDYLNVGDMCTMREVLEYLTSVPLTRLKDVHPRHRSQNRKVGLKQLYTSKDYFARAIGQLPNIVRGTLYSRGSKYMVPLVLFVKTNENMDTACFNCDEYIVGGAKDYVPTPPTRKMPVIARHIMCRECYIHEVKMFNPYDTGHFQHYDEQYENWEKKREWSEEE
jgi:hypothetical protein